MASSEMTAVTCVAVMKVSDSEELKLIATQQLLQIILTTNPKMLSAVEMLTWNEPNVFNNSFPQQPTGPKAQEIIDLGAIPVLIAQLSVPHLQIPSASALRVFESATPEIIASGGIPAAVALLSSTNVGITEHVLKLLSNVADESPEARDAVLQHNIIQILLQELKTTENLDILFFGTMLLSKLLNGRPQLTMPELTSVLEVLRSKLFCHINNDVFKAACWLMCYLSDFGADEIDQHLIDQTGIAKLLSSLRNVDRSTQLPAVITIGNLLCSDHHQDTLFRLGVVAHLIAVLKMPSPLHNKEDTVVKNAIFALGNACTEDHLDEILRSGIMAQLIPYLSGNHVNLRLFTARLLRNATGMGSPQHIIDLYNMGITEPLCNLLDIPETPASHEVELVAYVLESVEKILHLGEFIKTKQGVNPFMQPILNYGTVAKLEGLTHSNDENTRDYAASILKCFFNGVATNTKNSH